VKDDSAIVGSMTSNDSFTPAILGNASATDTGTTIGVEGLSSTTSGYGVYGGFKHIRSENFVKVFQLRSRALASARLGQRAKGQRCEKVLVFFYKQNSPNRGQHAQ